MELKGMLMKDAKAKGICVDGYKTMEQCSNVGELVDFYIQSIDWCLEKDYPTLQYIRDNFSDIQNKGIYVGQTFHGEKFSRLQSYVFHDCSGVINVEMDYENAIIPMLYFANNCHITVICKQKNTPAIRVPLYIFGDNVITAQDDENVIFSKYQMEVK
jgi:hypothetical protein